MTKFPKKIKIGEKWVGEGEPAYFIADIGANFDGNLEKAKKLASAAAEAGVDCVKFQTFKAPKIVSAGGFASMTLKGVHGSWGRPIHEIFKDAEFPREWHKELALHCQNLGVHFSSSPWDFEAVDLLTEIGAPFIKVGSGDITWHEMLEYIAKKNRPVVLATGASAMDEVRDAVKVIENSGNNQLAILQCITNYPSKIESANINVLNKYREEFGGVYGYSDHSPGDTVVLGAVALGAKIIEKHFTLSKKDAGPDHPHSMEQREFAEMLKRARDLESALGDGEKRVEPEESETVIVQRRSLYSAKPILVGLKIEASDIVELRPALGIPPYEKKSVVGRVVKADIPADSPIKWEHLA